MIRKSHDHTKSLEVVIPGQAVSQKNNKQIIPSRPPRLVDNAIVKKWRNETAKYLSDTYTEHFRDKQVVAIYTFYLKDRVRRDIDNMISSCNDALVQAGILSDDNWKVLRIGGAEATVDKDNPRAEIVLVEDEWDV